MHKTRPLTATVARSRDCDRRCIRSRPPHRGYAALVRLLSHDAIYLRKHLVERPAVEELTIQHDRPDLLRVRDVLQRVRVEEHEVGELAYLDGAARMRASEIDRGVECRRLQRSIGVSPASTRCSNSSWRLRPGTT